MTTPQDVTANAEALIALLDVENAHLDARKPEKLQETEAAKASLVARHLDGVRLMQGQAARLSVEARRKLVDTGRRLDAAMTAHAHRVARSKSIIEGLVRTIAEHAEAKATPAEVYGSGGQAARASLVRNAYHRPAAMSVNRIV